MSQESGQRRVETRMINTFNILLSTAKQNCIRQLSVCFEYKRLTSISSFKMQSWLFCSERWTVRSVIKCWRLDINSLPEQWTHLSLESIRAWYAGYSYRCPTLITSWRSGSLVEHGALLCIELIIRCAGCVGRSVLSNNDVTQDTETSTTGFFLF